jgi:hypothetical protein
MKVHGSDLVLYPHKRAWVNKRLRHGPGFSTAKSSPSLPLTLRTLDCYKIYLWNVAFRACIFHRTLSGGMPSKGKYLPSLIGR